MPVFILRVVFPSKDYLVFVDGWQRREWYQ
nr:MAG TPA: phosphoribitoyl transferase [Caudoviricetes sp.]